MEFKLIAAMDKNRVIGKNNDIPWRIPNDWRHVNKTTKGHTIVMGRRNYESIGRALPDRRNIILSREKELRIEDCEIAHSINDVFNICQSEEEVFIFGGEQIYKMFMPYVTKMYITKIYHEFEGDTYFPDIDFGEWKEVSVTAGITDLKNPYTYYFQSH
ncbi:dihydrofolate reductase [Paenibacillus aceris]|uniref:Dihydrofolate reductase n=1 Tax=Paenibacillus aceris TaxID=869555 RepID=A0ABS4HQD6_9BACL|nr:dihydrofolate reductase (trimethoprim resistance protein) [Paenibacillus aceris]NHW35490.1 dihydrofolate reductase [Paenibacillus aceris]